MALRFEWERDKAASNLEKHGVSFDEASTVFDDPLARIFDDEDHSLDERREIIVGHSILNHMLVVSFVERAEDVIRIISVRKATRREHSDYEENAEQ